ncbi:methylated-DNA--protein-cysteine methyltransferase [Thermococcus alcaliphilus]|uniref:methylated-DNA--protein-cysteine methyltransferase n=1 Tax=Thermococcus alcaliphilus TaxID=139207 RepID=UPI002091685E|nr:methylated-DNA--protein-cysteine methyltransferase [Thermococcus alcaliphilus]MCO6040760.1 DUF1938 domain-containing protein [Thermococcus alcaliphilus]
MIAIDSFKIGGREIQIAAIYEEKIQGIAFSLDGEEFLRERIRGLAKHLQKRGVNVDLREKESDFPQLVYKVLVGEIKNEEALEYLSFEGTTPFEKKVYETLTKKVKRGEVIKYGELAKMLKSSPRAVGGAMKRNPYPIVVPCHRVVASSGLGWYTPKIDYKKFLLMLEGVKKWTS